MKKVILAVLVMCLFVHTAFSEDNEEEHTYMPKTTGWTPLRFYVSYGLFIPKKQNTYGLDIGLLNGVTDGTICGIQICSWSSFANNIKGIQLSGISNNSIIFNTLGGLFSETYKYHSFTGIQLSLIDNTADDGKGLQISSINTAKNITGLQIGILNYARNLKGIQIGAINIAKNSKIPYMIGLNAAW